MARFRGLTGPKLSAVDARTVTLGLRDAVELGHAWTARVAADVGIRVLLIKGPNLQAAGLRAPRVSGDVDVLVDPAGFDRYCAAIEAAGWIERPSTFVSDRFTLHSRSFTHDGWPCDLDVHRWFPGFLAAPAAVFDALWERRTRAGFAHVECDVPDRIGGILILALHSLRGTVGERRHRAELEYLIAATTLGDVERADAASLALATGCAATLEDVLPRLGIMVAAPASELASPQLRAWRERVASGGAGAYFWIAEFRRATWRDRATLIGKAIWPSARDMNVHTPGIAPSTLPQLRARIARYGRGLRSLPAALRGLRAAR